MTAAAHAAAAGLFAALFAVVLDRRAQLALAVLLALVAGLLTGQGHTDAAVRCVAPHSGC